MEENFKCGYLVVLLSDWGGKATVYRISELGSAEAFLRDAEGKPYGWYSLDKLHHIYNENVEEKTTVTWTTNFM